MPVQADSSGDADLLSTLKAYIKEKYNKPGKVFLGMVHRLDRPVGGVMVFARTSKAASRLSEQFRSKKVVKIYLAIVHGNMPKKKETLRHWLVKDRQKNIVNVVRPDYPGGKEAALDYEVIGSSKGFSLVKIQLHTGRPHQIRVQLAHAGHPLYGDQKYGSHLNRPGQQLALWSHILQIQHPTLKTQLVYTSQPPEQAEPWRWFGDLSRTS